MILCGLTTLVLVLSICLRAQEGGALPVATETGSDGQPAPPRVRAKRCSCSNWLDKECIYFCHLDIIWVNTPSKTLPYGLGRVASRQRRSVSRCKCADHGDRTCTTFCRDSSLGLNLQKKHLSQDPKSSLLTSLRQMVNTNTQTAKQNRALRKMPPRGGWWRSR